MAKSISGCVGTSTRADLPIEAGNVTLNGLVTQEEDRGHLFIRLPGSKEREHVGLTLCQTIRRRMLDEPCGDPLQPCQRRGCAKGNADRPRFVQKLLCRRTGAARDLEFRK